MKENPQTIQALSIDLDATLFDTQLYPEQFTPQFISLLTLCQEAGISVFINTNRTFSQSVSQATTYVGNHSNDDPETLKKFGQGFLCTIMTQLRETYHLTNVQVVSVLDEITYNPSASGAESKSDEADDVSTGESESKSSEPTDAEQIDESESKPKEATDFFPHSAAIMAEEKKLLGDSQSWDFNAPIGEGTGIDRKLSAIREETFCTDESSLKEQVTDDAEHKYKQPQFVQIQRYLKAHYPQATGFHIVHIDDDERNCPAEFSGYRKPDRQTHNLTIQTIHANNIRKANYHQYMEQATAADKLNLSVEELTKRINAQYLAKKHKRNITGIVGTGVVLFSAPPIFLVDFPNFNPLHYRDWIHQHISSSHLWNQSWMKISLPIAAGLCLLVLLLLFVHYHRQTKHYAVLNSNVSLP